MKGLKISALMLLLVFFCAGCKPDLVVNKVDVIWDAGNKRAVAEIANIGCRDAGRFPVYFDGDESPVSPRDLPQRILYVPGLAKGATVTLDADFAPLARPTNYNLTNVYQVTVTVDPKNIINESNETNNRKTGLVFKPDSRIVFRVTSGGAGVAGFGQGPSGDNLSFIIDLETGWTVFDDYTHVTFISTAITPPSLVGTTIRLTNGAGKYDFTSGAFSSLQFAVQVEDATGHITSSVHSFSGSTTAPLLVPTSGCQTGISLALRLDPSFSLDLGSGLNGDIHIDTSECISAANL